MKFELYKKSKLVLENAVILIAIPAFQSYAAFSPLRAAIMRYIKQAQYIEKYVLLQCACHLQQCLLFYCIRS